MGGNTVGVDTEWVNRLVDGGIGDASVSWVV